MTFSTPLLVSLVATLLLGGCCNNRSLLRPSYSNELIDTKVRAELKGVTTREDRFHTVAGMVDWSGLRNAAEWGPYKVVTVDANDLDEVMTIPLISCNYGMRSSYEQVAITFNTDGGVRDVRRECARLDSVSLEYHRGPPSQLDDPWYQINPETTVRRERVSLMDDGTTWFTVSPDTSRYITVSCYGHWPVGQGRPVMRVKTSPSVDFRFGLRNGPYRYTPELAGGYIVQEQDFAARSGNGRYPAVERLMFVPDDALFYQCEIILAPHRGVTVHLELVQGEESNP